MDNTNAQLDYNFRATFIASAVILFLSVASIITNYTYLYNLFLNTYPKDYLPYLYISQAIMVVLFLYLTKSKQKSSKNLFFAGEFLCLAAIILMFFILLQFHFRWVTFIFCAFLLSAEALIGTTSWLVVSAAYNIREFKTIGKWINLLANLGGVIAGFSSSILIKYFGSNSLLWILIVMLSIIGILILKLRRVAQPQSLTRHKAPAFSYTLFRQIFIYTVIAAFLYTLIDYSLKSQLAITYHDQKIGEFLGLFYTVGTIVAVLAQLMSTKKIISKYSAPVLLAILPIFWGLTAIGVTIYPGLITITLIASGWIVFNYSYNNLGVQLTLNILPDDVKQISKFILKAIAFPIGLASGSIILWLSSKTVNFRLIALIVIIGSGCLIYLLRLLIKQYGATLENSLTLKNFSGKDEFTQENLTIIQAAAKKALNSKQLDIKKYGLFLLRHYDINLPIAILIKILSQSKDIDLRLATIKLISKNPQQMDPVVLSKFLKRAKNPAVFGSLLTLIAQYPTKITEIPITKYLASSNLAIRFGAILMAFNHGELHEIKAGIIAFSEMLISEDIKTREYAAKVIEQTNIGNLTKELNTLICDADDRVSIAAMRTAASKPPNSEIISSTALQLAISNRSYQAINTLISWGDITIDILVGMLPNSYFATSRNIIRALILLDSETSKLSIFEIYKTQGIFIQHTIAKEVATSAVVKSADALLKSHAAKYIKQQTRYIYELHQLSQKYEGWVKGEIIARLNVAIEICLYWFAIYTEPYQVLQIMPLLLNTSKQYDKKEITPALELLDTLAKKKFLKAAVAAIENPDITFGLDKNVGPYKDKLLTKIIATGNKAASPKLSKLFILRQNILFRPLLLEYLLYIAKNIKIIKFKKHQIIFKINSAANGLFIVANGEVAIIKEKKTIATLIPYNEFGEISLIENIKRTATAKAITDTTLLYLDRDTFSSLITQIPDLLRATIQLILHYLRENIKKE